MSPLGRILGRREPEGVVWPGRGVFRPSKNRTDGYEGVSADWMGSAIDFIPDAKTPVDVARSLATADALLAEQSRWDAELQTISLREAYPLWRDSSTYREAGDPPLEECAWWAEVSIMFVAFDVDGEFEFMLYGGDGPLCGMKFVAHGNVANGFAYATD